MKNKILLNVVYTVVVQGLVFKLVNSPVVEEKQTTMVFAYFKTQIPPTAGEQAAESTELHQCIPTE